jgi:PBSX family phage terminase large subunit
VSLLDQLPLSPKQITSIVESRDRRLSLWHGAVRSGKTVASLVAFLMALAEAPPSGLVIICSKTLQTAERNLIEPLQDPALFGPIAPHVHHTRGASTAVILGRVVHIIGASDTRAEGKLRGLTACLIVLDEVTLMSEEFVKQAQARASMPGARILMTTNPAGPRHWLRQNYLLRAGDLDMDHWHFILDDNSFLDPAYVEALKAEMAGVFYARNIDGKWIAAEGSIYSMWDEGKHVVDECPPILSWPCVGVDYGTTNPFSALLLGLGADGRLYFTSEYRWESRTSLRQKTDVEYSTAVSAWLDSYVTPGGEQQHHGVIPERIVVDPSATSFITQLWRDGWSPVKADNAVLDGIRLVSSLLARDLLRVHKSCTGLVEEFPGYVWDEAAALKGEDRPLKVADHSLDAGRYAIATTEFRWKNDLGLALAA